MTEHLDSLAPVRPDITKRARSVADRRGVLKLVAPLAALALAVGCGGGKTPSPSSETPPVDPCSPLGQADTAAVFGQALTIVHEPVRFRAETRGVYGFRCKWVATTNSSSVEVLLWPLPVGATLYDRATHVPPGSAVSPRPSTTVVGGVPGIAVTLPGEVEFMTPKGLVAVVVNSNLGRAFQDRTARTLASIVAVNVARMTQA